jgi:ectoine hydroxylase-related dioxygenase (phytanoyl-CoA dioxygenase family)
MTFSEDKIDEIEEEFSREGWTHIPGVLPPDFVEELLAGVKELGEDPTTRETHNADSDWGFFRLFERTHLFRDMLVREPAISIAERILGKDCHLINDGCVYNPPGHAHSGWHVDDNLYFPLPDEIPRFDSRIRIPNLIVNFQFMLTDVPSVEYGPTQVVPRSHYSGRRPDPPENPTFEGQGPVSILCKAGDLYLQHGQLWHRGAPNTLDRRRCLYQVAYGDRRMAQRLFPNLNYQVPPHILEGADERLLRVLGKHPVGYYG